MSPSGLEGPLCTRKPTSTQHPAAFLLMLIYPLAKLQSLQFTSALYNAEVKAAETRCRLGWGKKLKLGM